jgi:hypothetical protein
MKKTNTSASESSAKTTKVVANVPVKKANEFKQKGAKAEVTEKKAKVLSDPKVLYLAEGKKGKDLMSAKIESNRLNKAELKSLSFQIKQFQKHGSVFLSTFRLGRMEDITPKNLIPHIGTGDAKRQAKNGGNWSYYMLETCVANYYKSKAKK